MPLDPAIIVAAITSLTAGIGFVARAGLKGDWVFGREFKAMRDDRDFWRKEARASRRVAAAAVTTGEHLVPDDPDGP